MPKSASTTDMRAGVIANRSVTRVLLARILTNRHGGVDNRSSGTNRSLLGKVSEATHSSSCGELGVACLF